MFRSPETAKFSEWLGFSGSGRTDVARAIFGAEKATAAKFVFSAQRT
jgi:ABC-type sugar transport system ATPase subunit